MLAHKEKYIVDETGKRTAVVLEISEYEKLMDDLEELESVRAYDTTRSSTDEAIPFEQAVSEIENNRS